ncbi:sensor histidine kinase [Halocalculus aciditolerans]|uniref:histidine kinase n=1 Tax=Halocalculus aciditolerans TaxID=1383812 RepID=A0A830F738_9EURY|nr:PAS domain-containing sensor histidine kinase [Halocalculus aciditolerans]GGL61069.1 hypothetical protein GCM10009039_19020 [Halocalculus aciditolerans]
MSRLAERVRPFVGPGALIALGALLVVVPVYDVFTDVYLQRKLPFSTLLENALPVLCAALVVAAGVWLAASDRDTDYADTVAAWGVVTVVAAVALHVWVIGIQLVVQDDLKPFVIAADAIVAAAVLGIFIGVSDARTEARTERLETERDRFGALFENTTDCVAELSFADGDAVVTHANGQFRSTFADGRAAEGRRLRDVVEPASGDALDRRVTPDDVREATESEVHRETAAGDRLFLRRFVPLESDTGGYVVYTDVTDQKRLAEERAERNRVEYLHDVASQLGGATERERAHALAMDAVAEAFDFEGAVLSLDGDVVTARNAAEPICPNAITEAAETGDPVFGTTTRDGRTYAVVTAGVGDRGALQTWGPVDVFDERDGTAAELLTTHLTETLRRLDREARVQHERERLEFINRILRHNLLNGMNVVDARVDLLKGNVDESHEDHLAVVDDRVDDMVSLIETIRAFMQTIVERADHELEPVALADTLEREVAKLRDAHPAAAVRVDALPAVDVLADDLLPELFENLLTNAVQHNDKPDPRVAIEATADADAGVAVVHVADNGPGVPDDEKDDVFDKGVKGLSSPGSGFGLYLVREIVDTYGGRIAVADNDPEGAVFTVELPLADAERDAVGGDRTPD